MGRVNCESGTRRNSVFICRRVHVTEETVQSLNSKFETEDGRGYERHTVLKEQNIKTYLIIAEHPRIKVDSILHVLNEANAYLTSFCVSLIYFKKPRPSIRRRRDHPFDKADNGIRKFTKDENKGGIHHK